MGHRTEHAMMCYASLAPILNDNNLYCDYFSDHMTDARDIGYMAEQAGARDVAGLLYERVRLIPGSGEELAEALRPAVKQEILSTAKMIALCHTVDGLFRKAGIEYIPLKGGDPRLAEGSRGFYNPMTDFDVLVRFEDRDEAGCLLEENGFHFQGVLSGSHMTFFSEDEPPCYIELHWDLINRNNKLHAGLFKMSMDAVWERRVVCDGYALLSAGDLLGYSLAHALKEYFHKPKWLADCAWILYKGLREADLHEAGRIVDEWGVNGVLGLVLWYLKKNSADGVDGFISALGLHRPGLLRRALAVRLDDYDRLRLLRPLLFVASAPGAGSVALTALHSGMRAVKIN